MPGTRMVEGRSVKGNGSSDPISTSDCACASASRRRSARNTIGGDADAAADQQPARQLCVHREALADGTDEAHAIARAARGEQLEPRAHHLVEQLDPAGLRIGTHDRQRPPHGHGRIHGDVREAAGHGARGAAWCRHAQDELPAVELAVLEHARLFHEDGAAMRGMGAACLQRRALASQVEVAGARAAPAACDGLQHRHAHRHARWPPVRGSPTAGPSATAESISTHAVHRLRMHHDGVALREREPLCREPVVAGSIRRPAAGRARRCAPFWMRSIITTSQPARPSSSEVMRVQPGNSLASGSSAAGATMRRSRTPSFASACCAERATRECRMSPTIATASFAKS